MEKLEITVDTTEIQRTIRDLGAVALRKDKVLNFCKCICDQLSKIIEKHIISMFFFFLKFLAFLIFSELFVHLTLTTLSQGHSMCPVLSRNTTTFSTPVAYIHTTKPPASPVLESGFLTTGPPGKSFPSAFSRHSGDTIEQA